VWRHIIATILVQICLYCLNCNNFGQLILRKINKIVATKCHILRLKCTKFDFGWGSAPDPAGRAHSTPPDPQAGFKRSYFKGEGWEGKGSEGRGEERRGEERKGREDEGVCLAYTVPCLLCRLQAKSQLIISYMIWLVPIHV